MYIADYTYEREDGEREGEREREDGEREGEGEREREGRKGGGSREYNTVRLKILVVTD